MSLSTYITERLKITSKTKSGIMTPTSAEQLRSIIERELKVQGPDADLNFIDTSEITDMRKLFNGLYIRNIKIDQWDVSNVTNMDNMFWGCEKFKCDLSGWNVNNVDVYWGIFYKCKRMKSNNKPTKFR